MADFKRKRTQYRKPKVRDDNYAPPKRQRRGVSVFQRQLRKRKVWVEGYEAGKDQKRRDKRKVMRGYYRALRDLDREHKQIFGKGVSARSRIIAINAKKNGLAQNNRKGIFPRDVWNELEHPTYKQRIRNKIRNSIRNSKYNNSNNNQHNNQHNNWNNNRNYNNSFDKAMRERRKLIEQKEDFNNQREMQREEGRKAETERERQRKKRQRILRKRTRKGQPCLSLQVKLLLEKIKSNIKKAELEKKIKDSQIAYQQRQNNDNDHEKHKRSLSYDNEAYDSHSDVDDEVNGFLGESEV